jgi:hypothetical protein
MVMLPAASEATVLMALLAPDIVEPTLPGRARQALMRESSGSRCGELGGTARALRPVNRRGQ